MANWHDQNPWADRIVYVPLDELAEAVAGGTIRMPDGTIRPMDAALHLEMWERNGDLLDGYLLPGQPHGISIGVRYGPEGQDYLSLHPHDRSLVEDLYGRYASPAPQVEPGGMKP